MHIQLQAQQQNSISLTGNAAQASQVDGAFLLWLGQQPDSVPTAGTSNGEASHRAGAPLDVPVLEAEDMGLPADARLQSQHDQAQPVAAIESVTDTSAVAKRAPDADLQPLTGFLSTEFLLSQQMQPVHGRTVDSVELSVSSGEQKSVHGMKQLNRSNLSYWSFRALGLFETDQYSMHWLFEGANYVSSPQRADSISVGSAHRFPSQTAEMTLAVAGRPSVSTAVSFQQQPGHRSEEIEHKVGQRSLNWWSGEWQREMLRLQLTTGQAVVFYRNYSEGTTATLSTLQEWFDRQSVQQVSWYINGVALQGRLRDAG